MRIKCLAQGHYCRCQQIRTGDFTIESPWSYPLSHNSSSSFNITVEILKQILLEMICLYQYLCSYLNTLISLYVVLHISTPSPSVFLSILNLVDYQQIRRKDHVLLAQIILIFNNIWYVCFLSSIADRPQQYSI